MSDTAKTAASQMYDRILNGSNGRSWGLRMSPDLSAFTGAEWPEIVSLLLALRGSKSLEDAHNHFANPGQLTDPSLMPNLKIAVDRLADACQSGETVAVFGDFDVDGLTSTALLVEGLRDLGALPLPYIPHRFTEGYGPNEDAIRDLRSQGATLLVTVDCGTSATSEISVANDCGMDVIVVDHHNVPPAGPIDEATKTLEGLPDALAIVNPKLYGSRYGSEPAAVGVAYKVIQELYERLGQPYDTDRHHELVALGTVCDLVPMLSENRTFVRLGLGSLARSRRPGLRALADVAGVQLADADEDMCGWVLGPRLNAAGRMANSPSEGRVALDLLLTQSDQDAKRLADQLEQFNTRRREQTSTAVRLAGELLEADDPGQALLVVASTDISAGVCGLVAARLVSEYGRPAIVIQLTSDEGRASCRSINGFDITALLQRHHELFRRFGGHHAAAGFTIDLERLPEVRLALGADVAERLDTASLTRTIDIDAELPLREVNSDFLGWLSRMAPHGIGNSTPVFLSKAVRVRANRVVGIDRSHLQFTADSGRTKWRAISFGNAQIAVPNGDLADIVYTFQRDEFRGGLQLNVLDLRPTDEE